MFKKTNNISKVDKMNTAVERKLLLEKSYKQKTLTKVYEDFEKDYNTYKNRSLMKCQEVVMGYILPLTFGYKLNSIRNNLGKLKKIIKDQEKENEEGKYAINTLSFIDIMMTRISPILNSVYDENVEQRIQKKQEEGNENPLDVIEEIKRIKKILSGTIEINRNQTVEQVRSYYLAYIIGLSTGRRFTEILKTIVFTKHGKKQTIKGLLKKRQDDVQECEGNFIHLSYAEIRDYLQELRKTINAKLLKTKKKTLDDTSESEINSIFSKVFNNATARISPKSAAGKPLVATFHDLRHHYNIKGVELFAKEGESADQTEARILCKNYRPSTYKTSK